MYYPPIPNDREVASSLKFLSRKLKEEPDFLTNPQCPYGPELVGWLQNTLVSQQINMTTTVSPEDLTNEIDIEVESTLLFREMKTFKTELTKSDVNEKAAMFRTLTSLMEKIINVRERASSLKNYTLFEQTVIDAIDNYLEPKERTLLLEQLQKIRG